MAKLTHEIINRQHPIEVGDLVFEKGVLSHPQEFFIVSMWPGPGTRILLINLRTGEVFQVSLNNLIRDYRRTTKKVTLENEWRYPRNEEM